MLDQNVTLAEILDQDSLQRVCMSFSRLYGIGVAVIDNRGEVLVDIPSQLPLCRRLNGLSNGTLICSSLDPIIRSRDADTSDVPVTRYCNCGLAYEIVSIRHEVVSLGRIIIGPYRSEGMDQLSPNLPQLLNTGDKQADKQHLDAALGDLLRMTIVAKSQALQMVRTIGEILSVIGHTGYARHLTSQIHIAAIQDAYNELTEKNKQLADSLEKLRELDKLKNNFLATVSHELRTPLTSIIGYSEMMIEGISGPLSAEQGEYMQIVMEKGEALLKIINEMLDVSRIEAGNIKLCCQWVDVSQIFSDIVQKSQKTAASKEINFQINVATSLPQVWADKIKVEQVLQNLVSNALKFTPHRGIVEIAAQVRPAVSESAKLVQEREDFLVIKVRDTGIGIPEERRSKIFEAFYQVDNSSTREYGGAGLGLAIVKKFVEAHGGKVWVENGEGGGSIFFVELPVRPIGEQMAKVSAPRQVTNT